MSERLVLVERFDDVRPPMLFVLKRCRWCGEDHRGMIIRWRVAHVLEPDGSLLPRRGGWRYDPQPACAVDAIHCIGPAAVAERRVFRVDLGGLESTDATTTTAPRKLETVR